MDRAFIGSRKLRVALMAFSFLVSFVCFVVLPVRHGPRVYSFSDFGGGASFGVGMDRWLSTGIGRAR
jgi:hypothetical protein